MTAPTVRRTPYFTALSVLMPAATVEAMIRFDNATKSTTSSGGWGLGEIFIWIMIGVLGLVLGSAAVVIAFSRWERWVPVQWVMGLLHAGAPIVIIMALTGQFRH